MTKYFERFLSAILTLAAVIIAGVLVRREFFPQQDPTRAPLLGAPTKVANWSELLAGGARIGDATAPVQIVEFGDFECPFCRRFATTLHAIRERYPDKIALTFINFPIRGHRFAIPTARAAACAELQGRFGAFHDIAYEKQDSLGLKSWPSYARDAGVTNLAKFNQCNGATDPVTRVVAGQTLASKLGVHGTPTVIINGWQFGVPPTEALLDTLVHGVLAGQEVGRVLKVSSR